MKLLLVDSSPEYLGRRLSRAKMHPMLGLACVASYVEARGHSVRIFDAEMAPLTGQILEAELESLPTPTSSRRRAHSLSPIGPSKWFDSVKEAMPACATVLGGGVATMVCPEELFARCPNLDYAVVGEGEKPMLDLASHLECGDTPKEGQISGLAVSRSPSSRSEGLRLLRERTLNQMSSEEFSAAPIPNWSLFPIEHYSPVFSFRFGTYVRSVPIQYSRGCPYTCTFCSSAFGRTLRTRKPETVIEEMRRGYAEHGIRTFDFVDPVATANKRAFMSLCRAIVGSELSDAVSFNIETRADLVSGEVMEVAARAGCESVLCGLESGSQTVLDSLKKGSSLSQYLRAFEQAKDQGIHVRATLIIGTPSETLQTLEETEEFASLAFDRF